MTTVKWCPSSPRPPLQASCYYSFCLHIGIGFFLEHKRYVNYMYMTLIIWINV